MKINEVDGGIELKGNARELGEAIYRLLMGKGVSE